ncbi:MAG: alpha-glucosidase [Bacteroidota bacterium]
MTTNTWWKEAIIYQIYPRSFKDSTGNGIGDLKGILEKADYLADLGVDIIWLCPVYDSPNDDNGYDIRDYYKIHPEFGTMEDLDRLLEALHKQGMRLIMDLVVNHTSDEHVWFQESRKSEDNPYRDFYFWKKGKEDGPPNNWRSFFSESAWEYDAPTDSYYLHLFTKKQPDLNWENPRVREEVCKIMKFWLDKGVDGFRLDVIPLISKQLDFADTDLSSFTEIVEQVYSNGPKVHEYIAETVEKVISNYDVMTVGEGPGITSEVGLKYVGHDRGELSMIFHLDHMFLGFGPNGKYDPVPYDLQDVVRIFNIWDKAMGESGWISIFLDNHDFIRMVSRFGNDKEYRVESAKLLINLILTLRGTPSIYQGSEIGMTNVWYEDLEDFDDVEVRNFIKEALAAGKNKDEILDIANRLGRDNARTPMQWDDSPGAGFTTATPWLKINPNHRSIHVASDQNTPESILNYYKQLIAFRKQHSVFVYGKYEPIEVDNPNIFAYKRVDETQTFLIIHNFSDDLQTVPVGLDDYELVMNNYIERNESLQLRPWESSIFVQTPTSSI